MNIRYLRYPFQSGFSTAPERRSRFQAFVFLALAGWIVIAGSGCTAQAKKARHLAEANRYFDAGDYAKAEIEYRNVLQLVPMDPDAISHLAIMFFEQGRNGLYAPYLAKAYELQPDNLEIRLRMAMFDNASGKLKEGRDQAMYVLARRPDDEEAPLVAAYSARQPKEFDEVRQLLGKLPSAGGAPVLRALASLDMRQQKMDDAEARLMRAQALQPKSSGVALALGALYESKKDLVAAEKAYANAAAFAPIRSGARIRYAEFSMRMGKADQAKRTLTEATQKAPDFLSAWLLLAQIAEAEKKPDETLAAVGKILALDNVHHDAWLLSARAHLAKKEVNEAQSELERLEKNFPKSPELQYELGVIYSAKGEAEKAITALNQALVVAPNAVGANLLLAGLYVRTGSAGLAIKLLTPLLQKSPQWAEGRLMLAQAYRAQGNLDGALAVFAQMEKDFRANPQIGFFEGLILLQQNKMEEARQSFAKAQAINPADLTITEELVNIDIAEKKFAAAQQRVDALIASNPKRPELYLLRAKIFSASSEPKQAEAALQRVVELSPDSPVAYYLLAQIYLASHDNDKALVNLQQAVAKNPKNVQALIMIGTIQEQQKNYKMAHDSYEKALQISPTSTLALNNLAYLNSEKLNDLEKALSQAQEARKLNPASPDIADTLGWILYKKHDYAHALVLVAEAAEKMPANADVQYHFGMVSYMMGDEAQARAALERALSAKPDFEGVAQARQALTILAIDPKKISPDAMTALEKAAAEGTDPVALLRLGNVYEQTGVTDKAASAYEAARKAGPASVSAAMGSIRIHLVRHETAKALELAKATRVLAPNDPEVGHILGRLAFAAGDRTWALGLLQESARKLPDDPNVLFDLAEAAYSRGQVTAAEDALKGALAAHPAAALAAQAQERLDMIKLTEDPARAATEIATIESQLKSDPLDVAALMALAVAQEKRLDPTSAQKTYEKTLSRYDDFAPAQRNLVIMFSRRSTVEPKAIDYISSARQAFPDDADLAKAAGILFFRQGNFSRATSLLQESALKLKEDGEVMFYLGSAQSGLKDRSASSRSLLRALELGLNAELTGKAKSMIASNGKI